MIEKIRQLIKEGNYNIADNLLKQALSHETSSKTRAELYFEQGKMYWKQGKRSQAITSYKEAEILDPESPASIALRQAREIEDFFCPDLLNP